MLGRSVLKPPCVNRFQRLLDHEQTGMYGPPPCRKRKMRKQVGLRKCIRPSLEHKAPGLDGMRCALVLFSNAALEGFSCLQVSRAPGSTVVSSHGSPADLAEDHQLRSSRWSVDVGIANAISKPGLSQASSAGQSQLQLHRPTSGADRVHSWRARPRPCAPTCWLRLLRPRYCGCGL